MRRLTGVGMGPGDPELVTLKAIRVIEEADVVFAPSRRTGAESLALRCAQAVTSLADKPVVTVPFPGAAEDWSGVARRIGRELESRPRGVVLLEGDPTLFSSFGHLVSALGALDPSVETRVVPGITSVTACAAAAGRSLGQYEDGVAIMPGTGGMGRLEAALRMFECTVVLKAGPALGEVVDAVAAAGRLDEAVYVRRCSQPAEYVGRDLRQVGGRSAADYWSVVIVGGRGR